MHDRHLVVLLRVSGFQWDEGNRRKIRDRDISEQECEQVFANGPGLYEDVKHSKTEPRYLAVGRTDAGRWLFVVWTVRDRLIRVVTARAMHRREIRAYEEEGPQADSDVEE